MTDDEAFIRAIVAAPADDAPRLVYADWLDERGDQRGSYLREELAWAVGLHTVDRPSRDAGLLDLGSELDPIWVSRVSRPPIGICHNRLQFRRAGPVLTPKDIQDFERRQSIGLPDALAGLLLNHNGGMPSRRRLSGPFRQWHGTFRMLVTPEWSPVTGTEDYPVPLAGVLTDTSPGGGQVIEIADDKVAGGYFIGVAPGMMGVIYYAEDSSQGDLLFDTDGFHGIAPSLPELLAAVE